MHWVLADEGLKTTELTVKVCVNYLQDAVGPLASPAVVGVAPVSVCMRACKNML